MGKIYALDGTELSSAYDYDGRVINGAVSNMSRSIDISGIPVLHIFGTLPTSKDDGNVKVKYVFSNGAERFNGFATLKVQGNSTTIYPKKNFTIKLFTDAACKSKYKVSFNDWGEQNKYVLKADWIDISHARNIVSARLWSDVVASRASYNNLPELYKTSPNNCAVDGFIIKVYANGVYQGRYSWNIPKDPWMFNMDDSLDSHAVIIGEAPDSACFLAPALLDGTDWTDEMHEDNPPTSIVTRWNEIISFVKDSTDADFVAGIDDYINLDSIIDFYIFINVSCAFDLQIKNQTYITYDGTLFYASVYDMDSTWGLWWDGSYFLSSDFDIKSTREGKTNNRLLARIETLFASDIKSRYAELRAGALSADYIKDMFKIWCDVSSAELMALDYAPTTAGGAFVNMPQKTTNNYSQLSAFVDARLPYMDTYIASL